MRAVDLPHERVAFAASCISNIFSVTLAYESHLFSIIGKNRIRVSTVRSRLFSSMNNLGVRSIPGSDGSDVPSLAVILSKGSLDWCLDLA